MPDPNLDSTMPAELVNSLAPHLDHLRSYGAAVGRRDPVDVMRVLPGPIDRSTIRPSIEAVSRLEEVGVTWMAINGQGSTVNDALSFIEFVAASVIPRG